MQFSEKCSILDFRMVGRPMSKMGFINSPIRFGPKFGSSDMNVEPRVNIIEISECQLGIFIFMCKVSFSSLNK